ncbi:MAG: DUF6714 family protein [Dehalococcoidia bacterium]
MATDTEILDSIAAAFAGCPRPEHFTDRVHCCECAEHDATLLSRDVETLDHDDVGSPGWDPVCFITPEGFAYYLPALARLALAPEHPQWGWYGPQLFFHFAYDGAHNARWARCTPDQRRAVAALLDHIFATRSGLLQPFDERSLFEALEVWSDPGDSVG